MTAKFSKAALRGLRTRDRITAMQTAGPPPVAVLPVDDDGRRLLKHPKGGGFPASGSALWPDDRFTKRRLADGSVTREEKRDEEPDKHRQQKNEPSDAA